MATINFLLQSKKNPAQIYIRLSHGRKTVLKKKTGLVIDPKDWGANKLPKPNSVDNKNIASKLRGLQNYIFDQINDAKKIDAQWLETQIDRYFDREPEEIAQSEVLICAIENFINQSDTRKNAKGGIGVSTSRRKWYNTLLKMVKVYDPKAELLVKDVNPGFAKELYLHWVNKKNYAVSTATKAIADIKTICKYAGYDGVEVSDKLGFIEMPRTNNNFIIYLSFDELKRIEQLELKKESLINARRWMLLGCDIGQRGGDLLSLTKDNIKNRSGNMVLELKQQKTAKMITIPLLDKAKEIIQEGLPRKITPQNLNLYIKEVCELAGIDDPTEGRLFDKKKKRNVIGLYPKHKLIGTHVFRRSFASNYYGILPTPLIMKITGHSTEKMFLNYIGKSGLDYVEQTLYYYELHKKNLEI